MNQIYQTTGITPGFPSSAPCGGERQPVKNIPGNYDTVTLHSGTSFSTDDRSFAAAIARKLTGEVIEESGKNTSPEKLARLKREVSDGTYTPNAQLIARRLLGY